MTMIVLHKHARRIALAAVLALAVGPAAAGVAWFGDRNTTYDSTPGSPDRTDAYSDGTAPPADAPNQSKYSDMLQPHTGWAKANDDNIVDLDVPGINGSWCWGLWGYESFSFHSLSNHNLAAARLRFDTRHHPTISGEDLFIYDELGGYAANLDEVNGGPDSVPTLIGDSWQWVSVDIDLLTGDVEVYALDAEGNRTALLGVMEGRISVADREAVLNMAKDGDLYGEVTDDNALSYVEIDVEIGEVPEPATLGLLIAGGLGLLRRRPNRRRCRRD
jgi:hypothetical protein